MKVLVLAPHSDDEVLGVGGSIARHVKDGDEVHVCIVTQAYKPDWTDKQIKERDKEIDEVSEVLGVSKIYRLGLPTVKLDTIPQKTINDLFFKIIKEVNPEVIYIPNRGDVNVDHQVVYDCAVVATRPIDISISKILAYEVLSSTEWHTPYNQFAFHPNVYVDISDVLKIKIEAMLAYKHGLREAPHPRSIEGIVSLATLRGFTIGVEAAEAFSLVREIIK